MCYLSTLSLIDKTLYYLLLLSGGTTHIHAKLTVRVKASIEIVVDPMSWCGLLTRLQFQVKKVSFKQELHKVIRKHNIQKTKNYFTLV